MKYKSSANCRQTRRSSRSRREQEAHRIEQLSVAKRCDLTEGDLKPDCLSPVGVFLVAVSLCSGAVLEQVAVGQALETLSWSRLPGRGSLVSSAFTT